MISRQKFMARRRLLSGMAIAAGLANTRPLFAGRMQSSLRDENSRRLLKRLTAILNDETSAAVIGRAYMKKQNVVNANEILSQLTTALGGEAVVFNNNRQQLKQRFSNVRRHDFLQKNVVRVEGWVLASSEVKLYALAALA